VYPWFEGDEAYITAILDLGRTGDKPRKDLIYGRQMVEFIGYFFDDFFRVVDDLPENVREEDVKPILDKYMESYHHGDDQETWFSKIRTLGEELNYAARPKDYKKQPDQYKGHVGDVSTVIRLALVGRSQSPDLWEIQQILGEERTRQRIRSFLKTRG